MVFGAFHNTLPPYAFIIYGKLKYIKYAISRYVGEPKDRLSAHRRKEMNDEKQK
jgi:hypothetical protein